MPTGNQVNVIDHLPDWTDGRLRPSSRPARQLSSPNCGSGYVLQGLRAESLRPALRGTRSDGSECQPGKQNCRRDGFPEKRRSRSNNCGKRWQPERVDQPNSPPAKPRSRSRPPESLEKSQILPATKSHIIVENLGFEGRAQKIANQLYTTDGVVKVSADAQHNALIVTSQQAVSPWALIAAVARAQERPVAIVGAYGQMNIAWSEKPTQQFKSTSPAIL